MRKRILKITSGVALTALAAACMYLAVNCARHNLEHAELTDAVRQSAAGSFVHLSDGFTHYELAGPESGPWFWFTDFLCRTTCGIKPSIRW